MDVQLVPSRDEEVMRETFSHALVQGMLTGLQVIVSDRPILMEKANEAGGMGADASRSVRVRYVWRTALFAERYIDA